MTFALDWGRALLLAAPVVYPAAAWVLTHRRAWRVPMLAGWLAVALVYAVYMDFSGVERNVDGGSPPTYPVADGVRPGNRSVNPPVRWKRLRVVG